MSRKRKLFEITTFIKQFELKYKHKRTAMHSFSKKKYNLINYQKNFKS